MSHFPHHSGKHSKIFKNSTAKTFEDTVRSTTVTLNNRFEKQNKPNNKSILTTKSDGSIAKYQEIGLKQKLVNKVKSWNSKDKSKHNEIATSSKIDALATIACDLENLNLNSNLSEENLFQTDISKAKDSLEHILVAKNECNISNEKQSSVSRIVDLTADLPVYDHKGKMNKVDSTKVTWDPWNKFGRKTKKETNNKKRKDKSPHTSKEINVNSLPTKKSKGHTSGDELAEKTFEISKVDDKLYTEPYEFQPFKPNKKCVDFVNEVATMYFTGDEIISKVTEPLKKELDQQIRNKEMRRGHIPCTIFNKKQLASEDYMAAWFKK